MKQLSATFTRTEAVVLGQFLLLTLRRTLAMREIEDRSQLLLLEECIPIIDDSKMQQLGGANTTEHRMTDNVFRFMQAFVCDREIVVDLPNTVLALSDAARLTTRGFERDTGSSFEPLQKHYSLSQIGEAASDLRFVWSDLWYMQSLPKVEIYAY